MQEYFNYHCTLLILLPGKICGSLVSKFWQWSHCRWCKEFWDVWEWNGWKDSHSISTQCPFVQKPGHADELLGTYTDQYGETHFWGLQSRECLSWAERTQKPGDRKSAWLKSNFFALFSFHPGREPQIKRRIISGSITGAICSVLSVKVYSCVDEVGGFYLCISRLEVSDLCITIMA